MRVLILVLSCARPPWDAIHEAQRRTWDSVDVEDAETDYYFADNLATMPGRLRAALGIVQSDFVFRTNSSSYIDKAALLRFASAMPTERCYCGVNGGGFASGSGFLISRDVVEILCGCLPDASETIEDRLIGELLAVRGIGVTPGAERVDYHLERNLVQIGIRSEEDLRRRIAEAYHVRCKIDGDRGQDVAAMEAVHMIKVTPIRPV